MICIACGKEWLFNAGERAWYEERRLSLPKRCKDCRAARRAERGPEPRHDGIVHNVCAEYGFIEAADGARYYFRHTDATYKLLPGDRVTFVIGSRTTGPHLRALLIKPAPRPAA